VKTGNQGSVDLEVEYWKCSNFDVL
jgi:hypothetical protein